jgi:hypothetical protein
MGVRIQTEATPVQRCGLACTDGKVGLHSAVPTHSAVWEIWKSHSATQKIDLSWLYSPSESKFLTLYKWMSLLKPVFPRNPCCLRWPFVCQTMGNWRRGATQALWGLRGQPANRYRHFSVSCLSSHSGTHWPLIGSSGQVRKLLRSGRELQIGRVSSSSH